MAERKRELGNKSEEINRGAAQSEKRKEDRKVKLEDTRERSAGSGASTASSGS